MTPQAGARKAPASAFRDWYVDWDDGVGRTMLTPGASGYGLMVWNMPLYGCRHENYAVSDLSDGFLTVVPCAWSCAYGNDGYLTDKIIEELAGQDEDLVDELTDIHMTDLAANIPHVYVRGLRYPDDQWSMHTKHGNILIWSEESRRGFIPSLNGLAPMWTVVPIDRDFYEQWSQDIVDMWGAYGSQLQHTGVSLCMHGCEACMDGYCTEEECTFESDIELILDLAHNGFDIAALMNDPEVFMDVHEYALHRYRQGWRTAILRSLNGDAWSSSFSQVCSPWQVSASSLDSLQPPERQRSIA